MLSQPMRVSVTIHSVNRRYNQRSSSRRTSAFCFATRARYCFVFLEGSVLGTTPGALALVSIVLELVNDHPSNDTVTSRARNARASFFEPPEEDSLFLFPCPNFVRFQEEIFVRVYL